MKVDKKLKMAVVHINTCKKGSLCPNVMIAEYVSEQLDIPMIHNRISAITHMDEYDILFVKYGILLFCEFREELFKIYGKAKRIINLENDYTMQPDYRLTRINKSYEVWSNMPWSVEKHGGSYVNWNMLTWEEVKYTNPVIRGLGYYGSFRDDRVKYFIKYFKDTEYPVNISTFSRNAIKFRDIMGSSPSTIFGPFKYRQQIQGFEMVLYIEDVFIHKHYNSPANRFYECLYNKVPLIFDKSCINTFNKAGFDIDPYIVDSQQDVREKLRISDVIREEQHSEWYHDYRIDLKLQFDQAIMKMLSGIKKGVNNES
jgi:hypothetical protein